MAEELALGVIVGFRDEPLEALERVQGIGLPTVQTSYAPHLDNDAGIARIKEALGKTGIEITAVFCGFAGERYDDIPTVRATVGLVPEDTRAERVARIADIAAYTHKLGVASVAAHIGFIPEDAADPRYPALVTTVQGICDDLRQLGLFFTLETGQETAKTLHRFIGDVARDNLRVNFDPANMILYGNDNPITALDLLAPWVMSVHCKDGCWPTEEGKLGHEKPLGEGDVNIPLWIDKLMQIGFRGPLTIEREISGEEQRKDIIRAKELLDGLLAPHRNA